MLDIFRPYGTLKIPGLLYFLPIFRPIRGCPFRDKIVVVRILAVITKSHRDEIEF